MSSEIEVVEEVVPLKESGGVVANGNGYGKGNNGVLAVADDESLKKDIYTAAAYGDLEKLHRLVLYEGNSLAEPDGLGYYPLQWAALNNRTAAAQYIIEHGGHVYAANHNGQTALHWSAVCGAIQVAEALLQEGARVDSADINGYQITHVAAQYDEAHYTGGTPFHWAAIRGNLEACTVLV